ncbi:MAG: cupin domain-containing protein [Firmicutes bacterium]|nr:cupin domain-containing protein [Bacillota bacterium]
MKKQLVTAKDIEKIAGTGENVLYVQPGTIITPAAKDAAEEFSVQIKEESKGEPQQSIGVKDNTQTDVTPELIARIVKEVMASFQDGQAVEPIREVDSSGFQLVKGDSVVFGKFDTGTPNDSVGIKELLAKKESVNMTAGFMELDSTSFSYNQKHEEVNYVIEGTLDISINGTTYHGKAGDVMYVPKNTVVTFSTIDKVKFFYVTTPNN